MEHTSNYERQCEKWRQKFLTMDQEDICRRIPEIHPTEDALELWHFGRLFAVDRRDGSIRVSASGFLLKAFDCIPVRLNFWDGDEEIHSSAPV